MTPPRDTTAESLGLAGQGKPHQVIQSVFKEIFIRRQQCQFERDYGISPSDGLINSLRFTKTANRACVEV